jgi:transcriptional regulator with XRE-family HTH domain
MGAKSMSVTKEHIGSELRSFGLSLRMLRERAGLSQEALAHICGLHRTYVGSVERGERNVSLLNIYVLASALNVSASELIRTAESLQKPKTGRARS